MSETDEIRLLLGRVDGKLDLVINNQAAASLRLNDLSEDVNKLHTRVTVLETRRSVFKEWGAVLISIASAFAVLYGQFKGLFH